MPVETETIEQIVGQKAVFSFSVRGKNVTVNILKPALKTQPNKTQS